MGADSPEPVRDVPALHARGAGAASAAGNGILWDPNGNGNAETWADVRALLANCVGPQRITLNPGIPSYVAGVPGEVTDLHGSCFSVTPGSGGPTVDIANGAQLRNLGGGPEFGGAASVTLRGNRTGGPDTFAWDTASNIGPFLAATAGGNIRNAGTAALVNVPPMTQIVIAALLGGAIGGGSAPIVSLGAGAIAIVACFENLASCFDPSWIVGDATTAIGFENGGFPIGDSATWAGFLGTVLNIAFSLEGGSGPTALRPAAVFGPVTQGTRYFDNSLPPTGLPIWWDGAAWVDAAGAPH